MKQHKWHKEIKAWADGAEIEARYEKAEGWSDWKLEEDCFVWYQDCAEYRIKPKRESKYGETITNRVISNVWLEEHEARIETLEKLVKRH